MTPDPDIRLLSIIKALEEVIIPALDPGNPLAGEQAATALRHLHMLRGQLPYLASYTSLCLADMAELGRALAQTAAGGPATLLAAAVLRAALEAPMAPGHEVQARRDEIGRAVDGLIDAGAEDGSTAFRDATARLVLAYGRRQAWRDRAWYAAAGLDPEPGALPPLAALAAG